MKGQAWKHCAALPIFEAQGRVVPCATLPVLVTDSLAAHHDERVAEACTNRGIELVYLLPSRKRPVNRTLPKRGVGACSGSWKERSAAESQGAAIFAASTCCAACFQAFGARARTSRAG